jgi:hypothetical protein
MSCEVYQAREKFLSGPQSNCKTLSLITFEIHISILYKHHKQYSNTVSLLEREKVY